MKPSEVSSVLCQQPTRQRAKEPDSKYKPRREVSYWSWCSKEQLQSTENLDHVQAIIDLLDGKSAALEELRARKCEIDIFSFWVSSGQGGPHLTAPVLKKLAALELEIGWDMYFEEYEESDEHGT